MKWAARFLKKSRSIFTMEKPFASSPPEHRENAKYIKDLRLNGKAQDRIWFRHADVVNGLTIEAKMSETPNTALGSKEDELPPSSMTLNPQALQVSDSK